MDPEKLRIARDKLTRVFRYLEALNQHRNPAKRRVDEQLWSLWLHNLPEHPSIKRGAAKPGPSRAKAKEAKSATDDGEGFVLKVQRPALTRPPEPANEIAAWLEAGWEDPSEDILVRQTREESDAAGNPRIVNFDDDRARSAALQRWKISRDEWSKNEKPARRAMRIFEVLYALYGRIDREAERVELVLGDGILSWSRPEGTIYHPILLQRLQLQFNAAVPEFTLSEADYPVELYSALFQSMADVDGRAIGRCREDLEQGGFHPLMNGSTSGFLKRLVVQLSPRGELIEDAAPDEDQSDPRIGRDPILFLRARNLGFAAAIEGILSDLRVREDLPWSLLNIVGEESPVAELGEAGTPPDGQYHEADAEVLLSKPANPEQVRIAKQLEEYGGVLVQGPPGTGKTHTIGNLVGHLLAQGKSVLVTSHTTKALRMVRHHIVPELRPLCVSLLESDLDSRKQLESAVGSIAERLSRADAGSLEMEAKKLEAERPDLRDRPGPEDFEASLSERNRLSMEDLEFRSDLWQSGAAQGSPEELEVLSASLRQAVEPLSGKEKWKLAAVYAGKYGDAHREPWDQLVSFVRLVHREAAKSQESFVTLGPHLSDNLSYEDQERIAGEIFAHLDNGGKLGSVTLLTHRAWSQFIEATKVHKIHPRLAEHFLALGRMARLKNLREELSGRWDRQMATLGTPPASEVGEEIEKTLLQYCDSIEECLSWHNHTWRPLQQQLEDLGFRWEEFLAEQPAVVGADGELVRIGKAVNDSLLTILDSRSSKLRLLQRDAEIRDLKARLKLAARVAKSSKATAKLLAAVSDEDSGEYRDAYERLLELKSRQADLDLRRALLSKLESAAPAWAAAIRNRTSVHGRGEPPRDPTGAWTWRQLNDELDRRASVSLDVLQTKSEKLREQLRRVTVSLIDKRPWTAPARRPSHRQRQALVGWLDTIRRIGKGHGIRVSLLRAEAARKMSECRSAVPVWVMPLSRVVENFDPHITRFDVVIIDEASQSDVMALVALYLGKTVLVVGDHEQVSPSAVGQDLGIIQYLIF